MKRSAKQFMAWMIVFAMVTSLCSDCLRETVTVRADVVESTESEEETQSTEATATSGETQVDETTEGTETENETDETTDTDTETEESEATETSETTDESEAADDTEETTGADTETDDTEETTEADTETETTEADTEADDTEEVSVTSVDDSWEEKTGTFTIADTVFTVTAGESDTDDFTVTASDENGSVELATSEEAIIWADLGGNGSGTLDADDVTDLTGDISSASVEDNQITLTFDGDAEPASYLITVKDNSATGNAKADGTTYTYSMQDGSVVSTLYTSTRKLTGGASVTSTDKLLTVVGNNGIYYHGTQHGIVITNGDAIQVKVAGDAKISFGLCAYSSSSATIVASTDTGSVYVDGDESATEVSFQGESDGATVTFCYEGDATELTFTVSATGSCYLHEVAATNEAPETEVDPDAVEEIPEIIETVGNADNLTAVANGQKLVLTQTGGTLTTVSGAINPEISYFAFPDMTTEFNTLEADITISSIEGSGNSYGLFLGAFDENYAALAGIRNKTNIRGLYSKSAKDMLGAGQVNQTMTAGETLHLTAYKTSDYFYIETSCEADDLTYTSTYKYNSSSFLLFNSDGSDTEVYYGLVAAGVTATVTNLTYYDADGNVLFDQNEYYLPLGEAPEVTSVTAVGDDSREYITVSWTGESVYGDGKYVLQVSKDGGDYTDVADDLTEMSYSYPVTEAGTYTFRVCGTLGNSTEQAASNRNTYVTSNEVEIVAALTAPEVSVDYLSATSGVELSWSESDGAEYYVVYRRSSDETDATQIATVEDTSYTDTDITAEVPYYYSVQGFSSDNYSNLSDEAWTLPSDGHTGDYVYEDGELYITKKSYDTVYCDTVYLEGVATAAGTVTAYVNGTEQASETVGVRETFSFPELTIEEGRNDVTLILTKSNGDKVRETFNFVYLTNYDIVVDASYSGTDGEEVDGIPYYSTVQAAVDSVPATNTTRKVILIKAGDYEEENSSTKQLIIDKPYISLIGEDSEMVCLHNQPLDLATDTSTTTTRCFMYVQTAATGFSAENLTVENDWEYLGDGTISNESADAILTEAEGAVYTNVRFLGYQDTINPNKNHQYFYKCYITGNVDFIYGSAGMVLFEDCDIVFRYNANKNSGYVTAPKSDGVDYGLIFDDCRITAESGCSGSKYYLGRPWGEEAAVTFIDCYMGSVINASIGWTDWSGQELSTNTTALAKSRYYECGTYGDGFAVNANRRQISPTGAEEMLSETSLGWSPSDTYVTIGTNYVGSIATDSETAYVEKEYTPDTYSGYESDDTGVGQYLLEGFAETADTTGGGLLYETSDNYYEVASATEFLDALVAVKKSGQPSVIELQADICLGDNEVDDFDSYSSVITSHSHPALTHPLLMESGVSKLYIKGMSDLTIFSKEGYSLKHVAVDINGSENIIIRNIRFDELWEWDEETEGDYDVNDWDYVTVEGGSDQIWIDHCTFHKAYDGVVDIKTDKTTETNVTISWCEFLPGSEENEFFNQMMDTMAASPEDYPYYASLLEAGMSEEQIWWYAYGQKKTHLVGQSDDATTAININLTLANNYYFDSMDRMPRMRYGTAHVYNCIMDAQELLTARDSITNADAAKHIVSNGASSTCDGEVLLENCKISGIINALNSGNGSSPSGYINAINSLYYMYGTRYALSPKVNTTKDGESLKILDADEFVEDLPYSDYNLYSAKDLEDILTAGAGAGKMSWSVLQWEKTVYYDSTFTAAEWEETSNDGLSEYTGTSTTSTDDTDSSDDSSTDDTSSSDDSSTDDTSSSDDGTSDDTSSDDNTTDDTSSSDDSSSDDTSSADDSSDDSSADSTTDDIGSSSTDSTSSSSTDSTSSSSTDSTGSSSSDSVQTLLADVSDSLVSSKEKNVTTVPSILGKIDSVAQEENEVFFSRSNMDWESILDECQSLIESGTGTHIKIEMSQDGVVPAALFNRIANTDLEVTLEMENGISWKVLGSSITGEIAEDIDMTVTLDAGAIPEELLGAIPDGTDYRTLSLAHDGEFGFEATLYVKLEDVDDAESASLFYYHESEDAMEYMSSSSIDTEGYVAFAFTHASDYVILMGDTALAAWPQAAEAGSTDVSADASDTGADAMQWPVKNLGIGLIVAVVVVFAAAVIYQRKRQKR